MNILKPIECNGCIHEYSPQSCPCCEVCEVMKRHKKKSIEKKLKEKRLFKEE